MEFFVNFLSNRTENDTNLIMIKRLKRKDPIEWNASGSLPEKSEMDLIMEDYLERKEEQEREGSNFFHTDSPTNAGGAALYIASNLKAAPKPDIKFDIALVESYRAEIDAGEGKKKIIICCIYKHPLVI